MARRHGLQTTMSEDGLRFIRGDHLVMAIQWRGFKKGDRVRVNPRYLKPHQLWMSGHIFEFRSFTTNISSGLQWIDLFGGKQKYETWYSIAPQPLIPVRSRR